MTSWFSAPRAESPEGGEVVFEPVLELEVEAPPDEVPEASSEAPEASGEAPELSLDPGPYAGRALRLHLAGEDVAAFQRAVGPAVGVLLSVDGAYGPLTEAACVDLQRQEGLVADGVVGPVTWRFLRKRVR